MDGCEWMNEWMVRRMDERKAGHINDGGIDGWMDNNQWVDEQMGG